MKPVWLRSAWMSMADSASLPVTIGRLTDLPSSVRFAPAILGWAVMGVAMVGSPQYASGGRAVRAVGPAPGAGAPIGTFRALPSAGDAHPGAARRPAAGRLNLDRPTACPVRLRSASDPRTRQPVRRCAGPDRRLCEPRSGVSSAMLHVEPAGP